MERYIISKGIAGLGNRLFALSNAIEYAQRTKRRLVVDWTDPVYSSDPSHNAFHDCFRLRDLPEAPARSCDIPSLSSLSVRPAMWSGHVCSPPYEVARYAGGRVAPVWKLEGPFRDEVASADLAHDHDEDVVMFVSYVPPLEPEMLRRHVELRPEVEERVSDFVDRHFRTPVLGVHVRKTDKARRGGFGALHAEIASALADLGDARPFLSTDNRAVIAEMTERYGASLLIREKWLPAESTRAGLHKVARDTLDAEQRKQSYIDAVIDMFLLSRCDSLIGQQSSTFSECAACYSTASRIRFW